MPFFHVLVEKTYLVIIQTDNAVMAKDEAVAAVSGKTGQKTHVFDTMVNVASVQRLDIREGKEP